MWYTAVQGIPNIQFLIFDGTNFNINADIIPYERQIAIHSLWSINAVA